MKLSIFIISQLLIVAICQGQNGLQSDVLLHPADGFTAYTLSKNEFVYNQSPFTLPFPSWAWWGITDRLTAEIDLLPLIGGLFVPPHRPVPSFNFRYRMIDGSGWKPTLALEAMFQHLWSNQNQLDQENLTIDRDGGSSFYMHLNASFQLRERIRLHISTGFSYTENLRIASATKEVVFTETINPDLSISIDHRLKPWISTHLSSSYGTTFVYLDNIPRKFQLSYGFRIAPFYKNRWSFLRNFRAELIGFYMYFHDVGEVVESVVPVFPYFYWQFKL